MTDPTNPWGVHQPPRNNQPQRPQQKPQHSNWQDEWQHFKSQFAKNGHGGNGANNAGPKNLPLPLIVAAVGLLWLAGGIYRVLPEENAVVLRFGKFVETVSDAGLHYHLPWPFETMQKLNVTMERRIEIGYRGGATIGGMTQNASKLDVPEESLILTGDANIVDIDFVVQWKVADAKAFLFNIRNQEDTIKKVAESALREVVGQGNLQTIITEDRENVAIKTRKIMQDILAEYQSGVMVTQVLIQDASVPGPVLEAFEDVVRANQQAETMRNQALKFKNEIVPQAQGEAARMLREAEAYRSQVVSRAEGDVARFNDVYKAYANAKNVTRERMYVETMEAVLQNSQKIMLDGQGAGGRGVVPYVSLNDLIKQQQPKEGK
jgi:modulator of FtsH protease HflK